MGIGTHDRGGKKSQTTGVLGTHFEIAKQILMATSPRRIFSKVKQFSYDDITSSDVQQGHGQ
jgi:hypothetical protein